MADGTPYSRSARALALLAAMSLTVSACVTVSRTPDPGSSDPGGASASPSIRAQAPPATPSDAPNTLQPRSAEPLLGYISLDESLPFVRSVSSGIRDAASTAGIDLIECDPDWSQAGVLGCANQLAQAGVHGTISFQPFDDLAAEVCDITGDAPTIGVVFEQGPCQVSRLDIDQARSGRLAGAAVGAFAAERWDCAVNAWISLESSDADPDGRARMQGYRDGFVEHCPLPAQALAIDDADRLATAQTQLAGLLPDIKGKPNIVVGLNEDAILGAMAAVDAVDRANQFWYSGQLADPSIRQHIACDDHYIASVAQFPERFGTPAVAALIDALDGGEVPPQIDAELELVNAENVRQLFPDTVPCDE